MFNHRTLLILTGLSLLSVPVASTAVTCFAPSPSVKRNLDMYEEIQTRPLTNDEFEKLSQLFREIQGNWQGQAETLTCKGTVDAPRQETETFDVDTDIESGTSNDIVIKSELHSNEKKQKTQETLTYYLTPDRLGLTEFSRAGDIEITTVAHNFLVYLRKVNKRTPAGGLVAQEFVRTIALYDNSLMMEERSYTNGLLEAHSTWKLMRK
jgi:hypothetical protein